METTMLYHARAFMTEIIHNHKSFGVSECGIDILKVGSNQTIIMTGIIENVTCPKCKEIYVRNKK